MGIYIFKRQALFDLLKESGDDFGKDLIPLEVKRGKAASYVYKGYWEDIGTIGSYYNANLALTEQTNCLDTYDEHNPIFTHPHNLPSPLIKGTIVNRSIIGQGGVIEAKEITNSILGIRIRIDKGTTVRDSIILGTLANERGEAPDPLAQAPYTIGENCRLEKTIVDEHAVIGNNVQLINKNNLKTFDGDGIFIRDGIIIVASGTRIPDGFIL